MALFSSGSPQTGTGDELLESIAAVVVGGTSLTGGRGSIIGTFFGALLIGLLYNAMNLLNVDSYLAESRPRRRHPARRHARRTKKTLPPKDVTWGRARVCP